MGMVPGNLIQPVMVIFAIPGTVVVPVTGAQENLVGLVTGLLKQLEGERRNKVVQEPDLPNLPEQLQQGPVEDLKPVPQQDQPKDQLITEGVKDKKKNQGSRRRNQGAKRPSGNGKRPTAQASRPQRPKRPQAPRQQASPVAPRQQPKQQRPPQQALVKSQPKAQKTSSGGASNKASGGRTCPGGSLEMCIDVYPSFSARIFGACVGGCAKRCPSKK